MPFLLSILALSVVPAADVTGHATDALRYLQPMSLSGSIFPIGPSNSVALFTFRRTARQEGSSVIALRDYLAPDGTLAARETVQYERGQLKRFTLEENQINARGSAAFEATADGKTLIRFQYETGSGARRRKKTDAETQSEPVLINDMIPGFIEMHWQALTNGQILRFRCAIIPRLETIAFTLRKSRQSAFDGRAVIEIEMRPASRLLQNFVDPVVFSVEPEERHRILRYIGRTTPKIRRGQTWDDLDAISVFDWKRPSSP